MATCYKSITVSDVLGKHVQLLVLLQGGRMLPALALCAAWDQSVLSTDICLSQDPAQQLTQLERENQLLRRDLDNAQRLLSASGRPNPDAALQQHLNVGGSKQIYQHVAHICFLHCSWHQPCTLSVHSDLQLIEHASTGCLQVGFVTDGMLCCYLQEVSEELADVKEERSKYK